MADAGLAVGAENAQRAGKTLVERAGFAAGGRGAEHAGTQPAVDRGALGVFLDEVGVAVVLHQAGDALDGVVPADALPFVRTRCAVFGEQQALLAVHIVHQAGAFRAQRAAADRVIRVAFDVEDARLGVLRAVTQAVHENPATYGTVGAVVAGFLGAQQLVLARLGGLGHAGGKTQGRAGGGGDPGGTELEELTSAKSHGYLLILVAAQSSGHRHARQQGVASAVGVGEITIGCRPCLAQGSDNADER
ncbi:hypothetical protein D3C81_718640 [compost metagenome]